MSDIFPPLEEADIGHRCDDIELIAEPDACEWACFDRKLAIDVLDHTVDIRCIVAATRLRRDD